MSGIFVGLKIDLYKLWKKKRHTFGVSCYISYIAKILYKNMGLNESVAMSYYKTSTR